MLTYVLNSNGQPLMPTSRSGKVRRLLKDKKAKVIKRCPFTIQLLYKTGNTVQEVNLGVDAGSKHIGISATTKDQVLYEADVELRNDIKELISTRRESRHTRRGRKTRYRAPRFNNRRICDEWLSPSVRQKIDCHLKVIENVHKILPVAKIMIETASFDLQKIKNPEISGTDYQQGDKFNFWNIREYVLFRDNHECQCCHGKSKDLILNIHHIESRKVGGNAPNNLITLCKTCHTNYHKGKVKMPKTIHRGMKFNDTAFMGLMRWQVYNHLKEYYTDVSFAYGYKTKNTRIEKSLPKEHFIDARCISGNPEAISDGVVYYQKKIRCHNRQIYKFKVNKGGTRKKNQAPYLVNGFRLYDKVIYNSHECFITGRRSSGQFMLKNLDWSKVSDSVSFKKLSPLETSKHYLTERRFVFF